MKNKIFTFILLLSLSFNTAEAQQDSLRISLVTCEPGNVIYELFGHTAIRIQDLRKGTDIVFNYGLFDFNTPHFIWRFSLGQTDYLLGATYFENFTREYIERGSMIWGQELNLNQQELCRLRDMLYENALPENRVYRYNFLYNNCASMPLDKITGSANGTISYPSRPAAGLTFRKLMHECDSVSPWGKFVIDLAIGAESDRDLPYLGEKFSPLRLKELVASAVITGSDGTTRPLAGPAEELIRLDHHVQPPTPLLTPSEVLCLLFLLTLIVSLAGVLFKRSLYLYDIMLFGFQGIAGLVIAFLFFFSEHPTTDSNWLIIVLNPLPLLCLPFMVFNIKRNRPDLFLPVEFIVNASFIAFSRLIPQYIEPGFLFLPAAFAVRSLFASLRLFHSRHPRKRENGCRSKNYIKPFMLTVAAISCSLQGSWAQGVRQPEEQPMPRLVVGITVDQLDRTCLERLMPCMGADGFRLLWTDGYNHTNASFDFDGADRASAIASLHTGSSPFQHGIVASRWLDRKTLNASAAVDDSNHKGINTKDYSSPRKLMASNIADMMKLSSNGKSRVCSVAIERDAAILAAGHEGDMAIWLNTTDGQWSTSDYYGSLPEWLNSINRGEWTARVWDPVYPTGAYIQPSSERHKPFSHTFRKNDVWDIMTSPFANDRVTSTAISAVSGMNLGGDDIPDLLNITLYAGNFKGEPVNIYSLEQQDIYIRLDQNIADIVRKISDKVGKDKVVFFLTSTGYANQEIPDLGKTRIPSGTISMERSAALLNLYLSAQLPAGQYVESVYGNHIYLNRDLIEKNSLAMSTVLEHCKDLIVQMSGVKDVFAMRDLISSLPDAETTKFRNSLNTSVSGDIIIDPLPGWKITDEKHGVTINSKTLQNAFPIIIYGKGIRAEICHDPISASFLAPTICYLTRSGAPNACNTRPLTDFFTSF